MSVDGPSGRESSTSAVGVALRSVRRLQLHDQVFYLVFLLTATIRLQQVDTSDYDQANVGPTHSERIVLHAALHPSLFCFFF